jgi:hypothetical protein
MEFGTENRSHNFKTLLFKTLPENNSSSVSATEQTTDGTEHSLDGQVTDMPLSLTDVLLTPIHCGRCRTRMNLSSIVPRPDHCEKRTFECPKCDFIETRMVSDPLKSEEVNRLADNVWPSA